MARTILTPLTLPADPAAALQAATKQYVDRTLSMSVNPTLQTANYTCVANEYALFDLTTGSRNCTFPSAPANGTLCGARIVTFAAGNSVSFFASGTDVFNKAGGQTSLLASLAMGNQGAVYEYWAGVWSQVSSSYLIASLNTVYQPLSTVTTKGDLYVATASGATARQGVGTNGQTLMADSTQTNGMAWGSREVGYNTVTANVGSITTTAVRIVGIASVAFVGGHKYRLTATYRSIGTTVANDVYQLYIAFGTGTPASNAGCERLVAIANTVLGMPGGTLVARYAPVSNITQDAYLYCIRTSGTGTGTVGANSTTGPMQMIIDDTT